MKKLLIFLLMVLCLSFAVSAAPPVLNSFSAGTEGYSIIGSLLNPLKQNADHEFHFHVFNSSNGLPLTNVDDGGLTCNFHLYNDSGNHIYILNDFSTMEGNFDFEILVDGNNFTRAAEYYYVFQCNGTYGGGFLQSAVYVNSEGADFESYNNFSFLIPFLLFIFLGTLAIVGIIISKKIWIKVILTVVFSFLLMNLLRLVPWFLEITNSSEIALIKTLNFYYSIGVKSFYFLIAGALIFLVIYIANGLRNRSEKKRKESWENWGKDGNL